MKDSFNQHKAEAMMRYIVLFSFLFGFGQLGYSDLSQSQSAVQYKQQRLVQLDKQIESLQQQKAQLEAEAAAHLERGGEALLPGASRRNDRAGEEALKEAQALNQQIQQLEAERNQVLLEMK